MIQNIPQNGIMNQKNGNRLEGTFLLRNLHGWCRIKAVKDAEKIGGFYTIFYTICPGICVDLCRITWIQGKTEKQRKAPKSTKYRDLQAYEGICLGW